MVTTLPSNVGGAGLIHGQGATRIPFPGRKAKTWNRSNIVASSLEALGVGSIPHQGTRSHVPQLKDSSAATRTQPSQINK